MTTSTSPTSQPTLRVQRRSVARRPAVRFAAHFLQMVVAMVVGMAALGPLWSVALPAVSDLPGVHAMVMATDMTVGMAAWMRFRRHAWPRVAEMSAAMCLPFVVLLVPYWAGRISGEVLVAGGHVLMLPLMLAAMLWRRTEYTH